MIEDTPYELRIKSYSREDLVSIANTMDREKNPERHQLVLAELASRPAPGTAAEQAEGLLPQVQAALEAMAAKKRTLWQQLGALVLSLVLFASLGLFSNSVSGILLLIVVLFVHESGHFIGMKLLRYKDVQMFFIPLFGAAVSGTETAPSGARKAVVSLLGPVPGIVIGVVAGVVYLRTGQPLLVDAARTFLFLNTFNLLPFHPLDGGRFFDAVLFSRHPKLELGFKIVTALVLGWLAVISRDIVLGFLAFVTFVSLRGTYISASVAYAARQLLDEGEDPSSDVVPASRVEQLVGLLRKKLPAEQFKPELIATYVVGAWQRIRNRPCPVGPAIGLVVCYVFFIGLGAVSTVGLQVEAVSKEIHKEIVSRVLPGGETVRVCVSSLHGQTLSETQVNDRGLFDGPQVAWHRGSKSKSKEGNWRNGYWNGEWQFWDSKGNLTGVVEYDMGKPIRYQKVVDSEVREVPREEWPHSRFLTAQERPYGVEDFESH